MKKSIWLRNSEGKPDALLTLSALTVIVILVKFLLAEVSVEIGEHMVQLGKVDATVIAALLTPTLGAYAFRRHTDAKFRDPNQSVLGDALPEEERKKEG